STTPGSRLACFTSWNTSNWSELVTVLRLTVATLSSVGFFCVTCRELQATHKEISAAKNTNREPVAVCILRSYVGGEKSCHIPDSYPLISRRWFHVKPSLPSFAICENHR